MHAKHKWLCLILLACVPPLAGCDMFTEKYQATAWVRVATHRYATCIYVPEENDRDAQPAIVRSTRVLESALKQPGMAELKCLKNEEDKVAWLAERLEAGYLGNSNMLQISMTGSDPDELKTVIGAVCQAYMDSVVETYREMDYRHRKTLEQACETSEKMILRKQMGCRTVENQIANPDSNTTNHNLERYLASVAELTLQINLRITQVDGLRQKIEVLESRLKEIPEADATPEQAAKADKIRDALDQANLDLAVCAAEWRKLTKLLEQAESRNEKIYSLSLELDDRRQELARMKKMHQEIGQQLDEMSIESQAAARVQMIGEPTVKKMK